MNRKRYVLYVLTAIVCILLINYIGKPYLSLVSSDIGVFLSRIIRDALSMIVLIVISLKRLDYLHWPTWLVLCVVPVFLASTIWFHQVIFNSEAMVLGVFTIYKTALLFSSFLILVFLVAMAIPRK